MEQIVNDGQRLITKHAVGHEDGQAIRESHVGEMIEAGGPWDGKRLTVTGIIIEPNPLLIGKIRWEERGDKRSGERVRGTSK